jgi:Kef-type K+ transport system membrane component KefB
MSYTVGPSQGPRLRPGVVTAASALLYGVAALQVLSMVLTALTIGPTRRVLEDLFRDQPDRDAAILTGTIGLYLGIALAAVLGGAYVVLGMFNGRGKNPSRIITWVVAGIVVLCTGCGLAFSAFTTSIMSRLDTGGGTGPTPSEVEERISEALPGWLTPASTVVSVVAVVALIAVIILLALPASNDFFRKEQEVWVPPTWPTEGGYPPPPSPPTGPPAGG